jgi:hypothetical protein
MASKYVWVVGDGAARGLHRPQFIIKKGNKYYLTLAVWEYDKAAARDNDHRNACDQIAGLFTGGTRKLQAVQIGKGKPGGGGQTDPYQ